MRVTLERYSKGAAEAEIGDLQNPHFLVQKQILRLEIAVENAMGVTVSHPLAELVEEALDHRRCQWPRIRAFPVCHPLANEPKRPTLLIRLRSPTSSPSFTLLAFADFLSLSSKFKLGFLDIN